MKHALRTTLLALSCVALAPAPRDAHACGGSYEGPVYINRHNPDLPLSRLRGAHPGVMPEDHPWHRDDRVVAWRLLTGAPLTDDEYAGWVRRVRSTHRSAMPLAIDASVPIEAADTSDEGGYEPDASSWYRARAEALGARGPNIVNEWASRGAWAPNCLADAFVSAGAVLQARQREYGPGSDLVRAWVEAQDDVFSNCGPTPGRTPSPLAPTAPELARRDRAWQIAAAHFYAGRFTDAERDFRAIGADASSPWSLLGRYLVVRTITRAAMRGRETPDAAELARAIREADALLAAPRIDAVRAMTTRYRDWLRALHDPAGRAHELGVSLAAPDADFETHLRDYARVLAATAPDPFARQPNDADRLTAWMGALEGHRASTDSTPRSVALDNYARSHASAWLVATLLAPGDPRDAALTPMLDAAQAVTRDDPAYATARYHRLRLLAARGTNVYADAMAFSATLTADDGPSALNLARELAAANAPDVERFVAAAHGRPAGYDGSEGFITLPDAGDVASTRDDLSPLGAVTLSSGVPLSVLLRAARVTSLPASIRERIVATALVRATWLDDDASRVAATALLSSASEPVRRALRPLAQAETRDTRHLELVRALLHGAASLDLGTALGDAANDTASLSVTRCERVPVATTPAPFLTAPQRAELTRERLRLSAPGDTTTWIATELARLAPLSLRDPELPAMLASAVRNTRNNGCPRAAAIHTASRAAFSALHRYFPRSAEARDTPYWF